MQLGVLDKPVAWLQNSGPNIVLWLLAYGVSWVVVIYLAALNIPSSVYEVRD